MKCYNLVGEKCPYCQSLSIKYGKSQNKQRYRCKNCDKTWLAEYTKQAFLTDINPSIVAHVKEGCPARAGQHKQAAAHFSYNRHQPHTKNSRQH